ncbi:MAG: hypothetical protein AAF997_14075 [Myxococcota bacterium]
MDRLLKALAFSLIALAVVLGVGAAIAWVALHPTPPGAQMWTGSHVIQPGNQADLVVPSENPLTYAGDLRDIEIEQTLVGGVTIYDRNAD